MSLIVKKFGGTSVADNKKLNSVADIIIQSYKAGNDVVVIVSAQGDMTDRLIEKAKNINQNPSKREMDVLLAVGEQMSMALLSMTIEKKGYPVVSLTGWQAGFLTHTDYGMARIRKLKVSRVKKELDSRNIVVIAGFQGINKFGDITTFGRGGSDTSAVAIAAALDANLCQIYTDVDGVYTADPKIVKTALKLEEISYDEMLELATAGAQVLHNRSVEMAKRFNVNLEVLSSFNSNVKGTKVKEFVKMEKILIRGVAKDKNTARFSLIDVPNEPGTAFKIFSILGRHSINVDIILQSIGRDATKDLTFTVPRSEIDKAKEVLQAHKSEIGFKKIDQDDKVSKVSIVGVGMQSSSGVAAKMFGALYQAGINIHMISTSEIKITVLIDEKDTERAVNVIHEAFFGNV